MAEQKPSTRAALVSFAARQTPFLLAGTLGLYWLIVILDAGIRVTSDSAWYLLFATKMHYAWDFWVRPTWPPLYPFLVSLCMTLTPFPAGAAAILSGLNVAAVLVTCAGMLRRLGASTLLTVLFVVLVFALPGFLVIHEAAWSEQPFCLFLTLHVYFLIRHQQSRRVRDHALAAACVALVVLSRYSGYAVLAAFAVYTVIEVGFHRKRDGRWAWQYVAWLIASGVPVALFLLRNYWLTGTLHGPRSPATRSLAENVERLAATVWLDLAPAALALFALAVIVAVPVLRSHVPDVRRYRAIILYVAAVSIAYCAVLLHSASTVSLDSISSRFLAPLYPCWFVFAFAACRAALFAFTDPAGKRRAAKRFVSTALYLLVSACAVLHLVSCRALIQHLYDQREQADTHRAEGFNRTRTCRELNAFLFDRFATQDRILVTCLAESGLAAKRPHLHRTLFYRGAVLRRPGAHAFRFGEFPNTSGPDRGHDVHWADYTITFQTAVGRTKRLVYRNLRPLHDDERLIGELRRVLDDERAASLLMIVYRGGGERVVGHHARRTARDAGLRIQQCEIIPPYMVMECTRLPG